MCKLTEDSDRVGHRARLRERLMNSKRHTISDVEMLELILNHAVPRINMKPLSKELIKKFGTFGRVINTEPLVLLKIKGVGESVVAAFRMVQEAAHMLIREEFIEKPVVQSWKQLLDYFRATMGHIQVEQFRVLYLNNRNMVIADELQEMGTINQIAIQPREIAKRALIHEAFAIILVHNHPSGITKPSVADIEVTRQIATICTNVGVQFHDHVIVSNSSYYSFKSHGATLSNY